MTAQAIYYRHDVNYPHGNVYDINRQIRFIRSAFGLEAEIYVLPKLHIGTLKADQIFVEIKNGPNQRLSDLDIDHQDRIIQSIAHSQMEKGRWFDITRIIPSQYKQFDSIGELLIYN